MAKTIDQIYNPSELSKEELIRSFVVRIKTFESIWKEIKEAKMKTPEQCILIEGQRGMGKTTLLLRLSYELENDKERNEWLLPVVFNEEEYGINRLYKMWLRVAEILESNYPNCFKGLFEEMDNQYPESFPEGRNKAEEQYEKHIFELLEGRLKKENKKIVLFIDNLGALFGKFTEHELRRLRGILITCSEIRIIAATVGLSEEFLDYKAPFYEFFKIKRLRGLDREEAQDLLRMLGASLSPNPVPELLKKYPNRIETLRRLTGGVTRTLVMLLEFLTTETPSTAFKDLEKILDRATPLYKHRMDDLPSQQQTIVAAIALAWDGIGVKEIAQETRLESKVISAQLSTLVEGGIIDAVKPPNTKNLLYQLSERFFNIWYLMRFGGKSDKLKVKWLTRFYESLLDNQNLNTRIQNLPELLKNATPADAEFHYRQALALTEAKGTPLDLKKITYEALHAYLEKSGSHLAEKMEVYLSELNKEMNENEAKADTLFTKALAFHWEGNDAQAEQYYLMAIEKGDLNAMNNLANLYANQNQFEQAEKYYLMAIERGDANAMFGLALLYANQHQREKAEQYYLMAIEKGDADAMNNLAVLYDNQHQLEKAEQYYLMAIEKGDANAMYNLALLYHNQHQLEKAEQYYLMAIEKGNDSAMNNLALLYDNQHQLEKAEQYYLMAIEKGDANAMYNLALLYHNQHQLKKAEQYYLMAIEKEHSGAMNNLAVLYKNQHQLEKAEQYYLMAIEKGNDSAMNNLAVLYDNQHQREKAEQYYLMAIEKEHSGAMYNLALLYHNQHQLEKAEQYYLMATEKGNDSAMYNLAVLYKNQHQLEKAEQYYLMAIEKGDLKAMNGLLWLYFTQNKAQKIIELLPKAEKVSSSNKMPEFTHTLACCYASIGQYELSLAEAEMGFWYEKVNEENWEEDYSNYTLLLLAKKQYDTAYDLFTNEKAEKLQIKHRFKPLYYTILYFLKDRYPVDYLRMGSDLEETVMELVAKVKEQEEKWRN